MIKNNLSLLYAEDDYDSRVSISRIFTQIVGKLYVAKDGIEALEIFKNHHVDFVVSDFRMPGMNGAELCSEIKKINPEVYFVLFTAFRDSELLIDAINAHVDQFLLKPVNAKHLFSMVDKIKDKINQMYKLDRVCSYLHDAEKNAHLFYWDCDLNTKTIDFENEVAELFDLPQELRKKPDYKVLSTMIIEEDRNKFLDIFERRIFNQDDIDEIVMIQNQNHKRKYLRIATSRCKSLEYGDKYIVGMFQDINSFEKQLEILKESKYNHMLRLDGKESLVLELDNFLKSSMENVHPVMTLFFEIENFKYITDKYGQTIADEILVELVNFIKNNIRKRLYFGRWSENEFVIVAVNGSKEECLKLSEELLVKVYAHTWPKNIDLIISLGLSFYEVGDDASSLIQKANLNMLESKKTAS